MPDVVKVLGRVTKLAACMTSTFDLRYLTVAKSKSGGRRRMTSDIRICRLLLAMRSSGQAGDFRIVCGAWRDGSHEGQPVVRADQAGEFGFLRSNDGEEIYFHRNSVLDGAFPI
ncbi:hypothetical protein ACH79_26380 [Bradyrhizobium sp. CCBAU 051011]|nr:hypothetical protein ACH79_26380 [Bradyrhizobium sp. CCBAU 051011]